MFFQRLALVLLAVAVTLLLLSGGRRSVGKPSAPAAVVRSNVAAALIQISGDVARPGIYVGFAKTMTEDAIILAKPACTVPHQAVLQQLPDGVPSGYGVTVVCNSNNTSVLLESKPIKPSQCLTLGILLDLNKLSAADLEILPGIGSVTARAVTEYRQKNGDFRNLEDLLSVEGIGEKTLQKISKFVNIPK